MSQTLSETPIVRRSLRDEIVVRLRARLLNGDPAPGQRIVESTLCGEFGVSRTPLREALLQMEVEGLVTSEPARGFVAAPLSQSEARDTLAVLGALEVLALRAAGAAALRSLHALGALQESYEAATSANEARDADVAWHSMLVEGCVNDHLLELIAQQQRLAYRYWRDAPEARWPHPPSVLAHRSIAEALVAGRLDEAALRLDTHWKAEARNMLKRL